MPQLSVKKKSPDKERSPVLLVGVYLRITFNLLSGVSYTACGIGNLIWRLYII